MTRGWSVRCDKGWSLRSAMGWNIRSARGWSVRSARVWSFEHSYILNTALYKNLFVSCIKPISFLNIILF